jgi:hypothetical protein
MLRYTYTYFKLKRPGGREDSHQSPDLTQTLTVYCQGYTIAPAKTTYQTLHRFSLFQLSVVNTYLPHNRPSADRDVNKFTHHHLFALVGCNHSVGRVQSLQCTALRRIFFEPEAAFSERLTKN